MKRRYYETPTHSFLAINRNGVTSVVQAILHEFYPELTQTQTHVPEALKGTPTPLFKKNYLAPHNEFPEHDVLAFIRDPVDRFLSGVRHIRKHYPEQDRTLAEWATYLEASNMVIPERPAQDTFRPQVDFLIGGEKLFLFPYHIDAFVDTIGVSHLTRESDTDDIEIAIGPDFEERIRTLYAADNDLYRSIGPAGQVNDTVLKDVSPPEPVIPVPDRVEAWRVRAIAKVTMSGGSSLHDKVLTALDAVPDPLTKAGAEEIYLGGNVMTRDSALLNQMAQAIGLEEEDLDQLFIKAAAIPT